MGLIDYWKHNGWPDVCQPAPGERPPILYLTDEILHRAETAQCHPHAGLYLVGAWLPRASGRDGAADVRRTRLAARSIVILLAIGFLPAVVFSWVFELTPQGLKRDADVAPEQSIAPQTARRMDRRSLPCWRSRSDILCSTSLSTPRRAAAPNDFAISS